MKETKERVERVEDLKAQVANLFGINTMVDEELTKIMKETLIKNAESKGEDHIEEVLNTIEKALDKIKDPQFKAIIASIMWTKCPIGIQKSCIKYHNKMLREATLYHVMKQTKDNSITELTLLATALHKINCNE